MVAVVDDQCTCRICNKEVPGVVFTRVYSITNDLRVCVPCYSTIQASKGKHHSKLMERVAMLETGYHINRKVSEAARLHDHYYTHDYKSAHTPKF